MVIGIIKFGHQFGGHSPQKTLAAQKHQNFGAISDIFPDLIANISGTQQDIVR